ncbi:MAG TPA: sensor histidine kinase [Cyclobacteriaceae bacterium]
MIRLFNYKHFHLIPHVVVWSVVLFFPFLVSSAEDNYKIGPHPGLYFTYSGIVHIIIFYLNAFFLYPKLLNKVYWILYVVLVVSLIFFSYLLKSQILIRWFPDASIDARLHILFPSVIAFIASLFYSITVDKIRTERLSKENEAMRLGMELKFLRSQINPHFLFNVSTNLVYLARKKSDDLEASLIMFSGLMRYMLYENGIKIPVQQEVEYLGSYVALQKLRFGQDVKIIFTTEISHEEINYSIEPMLLIPFIENAFKHGTGLLDGPSIDAHLSIKGGVLVFRVMNRFDQEKDTSKDEISGIGLNNVRSRLKLVYPEKHTLSIDTGGNLYLVNLTLKLS